MRFTGYLNNPWLFWAKSTASSGGCLVWMGGRDPHGYGRVTVTENGVKRHASLAHRVAWRLHHGRWPVSMLCHKCNNPSCVNVDHLYEGTAKQNTADMWRSGRAYTPFPLGLRGDSSPTHKLKDAQVREIKLLLASGETCVSIARKFGVHQSTISRIKTGDIRKECVP